MKGQEIVKFLRSGYSYFYLSSYEVPKSVLDIKELIEGYKNGDGQCPYNVAVWDFEKDPDPEGCLTKLDEAAAGSICIAKNFNWFLTDEYGNLNKDAVSLLQNRAEYYSSKTGRKALIIVGTEEFDKAVPAELAKDFLSLEMGLPDADVIQEYYDRIIEAASKNPKFQMPTPGEATQITQSLRGMTVREGKNALSFAIIEGGGKIDPRIVAKIRAEGIKKIAGLQQLDSDKSFKDVKGYEQLKDIVRGTLMGPHPEAAKGIILVGPPGTGKTLFMSAVANESGLEAYLLEIAQTMGDGLVGQAEKAMKAVLDFVRANAPCILCVDEIEKALSGVGGGPSSDGGTSDRSMAQLLKFLSDDRPEGVYVIATCNNIRGMPPEWLRAERWDFAPIFIDLPNEEEQEVILRFYQQKFGVEGKPSTMTGWSGAEIKAGCRTAHMMGRRVEEVEQFIIPISKTMSQQIDGLRKWAVNNTISASTLKVPKESEKISEDRAVDF